MQGSNTSQQQHEEYLQWREANLQQREEHLRMREATAAIEKELEAKNQELRAMKSQVEAYQSHAEAVKLKAASEVEAVQSHAEAYKSQVGCMRQKLLHCREVILHTVRVSDPANFDEAANSGVPVASTKELEKADAVVIDALAELDEVGHVVSHKENSIPHLVHDISAKAEKEAEAAEAYQSATRGLFCRSLSTNTA